MAVPVGRARTADDCVRLVNQLLDHLRSGVTDGAISPAAQVSSAKIRSVVSPSITVGTAEIEWYHGLGITPRSVIPTMTGAGMVHVVRSDQNKIVLKADAAARTCVVKVEG